MVVHRPMVVTSTILASKKLLLAPARRMPSTPKPDSFQVNAELRQNLPVFTGKFFYVTMLVTGRNSPP